MTARRRSNQQGQILVMAAAVMAMLFVPLCIYVIDTALVESDYAQLGETLQASTEDGASMIDQAAYRQSNGQRVILDPAAARATCEHSLQASGLPGLESWTVTVEGNTVTASATLRVQLMVVGASTLTETRSASFHYGG
jgi:hypothetical protein